MPLQHAESIHDQDLSVAQFEALARSVEADFMAETLASAADYARQHRDIIAEFGRFPHRNALLGRNSTDAELRFLESGGATFGQRSTPERPGSLGRAGDDLNA